MSRHHLLPERPSLRLFAVCYRNLLVWRKLAVPSLLGSLADPLIYMLGLGALLPSVAGTSYIQFLAAGTLCYSTMNSATFEALYSGFSRMHVQKTWDAIMNAPLSIDDIVIAEALWAAIKASFSGLAILLVAWALGLIGGAVALWLVQPLIPASAHGLLMLGKGVGIIALVAGISLLIGVAAGSRDPLQPLAILKSAASADASAPAFRPVSDLAGLDAALANPGRPVLLDVYADWCVSCKELERYTFADPRVRARMERMLLLRADVTANNAADRALLRRLGLFGPPGVVLFDAQGVEIPGARTIGFQSADDFLRTLAAAGD